jgi:2-C-methyl-D-erythritol 4-phosphate cytidylyltransferase
LEGIPLVAYALRPFEACQRIQSIYPVLRNQDFTAWEQEILKPFRPRKARSPVAGGPTRQDSVRLGLESMEKQDDIGVVLIHDGARPFLDTSHVEQLLDTMDDAQAAVLAVPVKDTIKIIAEGHVLGTPTRGTLWHIQTPQAFDYPLILEAHRKAFTDGMVATDDATLAEHMGVPVMVVRGSYRNIKITTKEDLVMARALVKDR